MIVAMAHRATAFGISVISVFSSMLVPNNPSFPGMPSTQPTYTLLEQVPEQRKIILQQQNLQDDRLNQCVEKGKNWEQCFFYGTDTVSQTRDGKFQQVRKAVPGGPPTW